MSKKSNHQADIRNSNRGTNGTNRTWDKAQGNRGKQLDPAQRPPGSGGPQPPPPGASQPATPTPPATSPPAPRKP